MKIHVLELITLQNIGEIVKDEPIFKIRFAFLQREYRDIINGTHTSAFGSFTKR